MLGDVKDARNAIVLHDGPTLAGHADLALRKTQGYCLFSQIPLSGGLFQGAKLLNMGRNLF